MNKILLALTILGATALSLSVYNLASPPPTHPTPYPPHILSAWAQWKKTHTKLYPTLTQESSRLYAFAANLNQIQNSNLNPTHTFKLGLNQFSDLTNREFSKIYLLEKSTAQPPAPTPGQQAQTDSNGKIFRTEAFVFLGRIKY